MKKELSTGKIIGLAVLAILLAIALALALTDMVRNVLAGPITRFFYFLGLLVKSTPQALFWGLILLFLLIVAGKSMQGQRKPESTRSTAPVRLPRRERVAFWAAQVNLALRGDHYSYTRLIEFLAGLALGLDVQEERITVVEIRQRLESGELVLPLEIENYLKARVNSGYVPRPSFQQRVTGRLARFWNALLGKENQAPAAYTGRLTREELEKVIQYLEDRLEV